MAKKKILYWECSSGISGDMAVASLLDAGADEKVLLEVLKTIPAHGFDIKIGRVSKSGLDCCDFNVVLDKDHENHDHDMEYLFGHDHIHSHEHMEEHVHNEDHTHLQEDTHHHAHEHVHEDGHTHEHHNEHHHEHRNLSDVIAIIDKTHMTENARALAVKIFTILAQAEAKAHGTDINHVHFHEVGAIDSIADIIAVSVCLDNLAVDEVCIPSMNEGCGTVRCQHGILPVPVPAVANIIAEYGIAVNQMDIKGEFITPTGAAVAAAVRTTDRLPDKYIIKKIGIGAGKRTYERPSILRAMIIETDAESERGKANNGCEEADYIYKLESNIDDCTGEILGYVMDRLYNAGAREVNYMPVFMKKNRPGWLITVICKEENIKTLENIIFAETTTIGIRRQKMERTILKREISEIATPLGNAVVKVCDSGDSKVFYPEYESAAAIAKKNNVPLKEVYDIIKREINSGGQCGKKEKD